MNESPKLGSLDRDSAERAMVLKMRIQDWVKDLREGEPKKQKGEKRMSFQSIIHLIRPSALSIDQKQLKHSKLYPWLRDVCGLHGIETVGDLLTVFEHAPMPSKVGPEIPWIWFGVGGGSSGPINALLQTRRVLIEKGLLQES